MYLIEYPISASVRHWQQPAAGSRYHDQSPGSLHPVDTWAQASHYQSLLSSYSQHQEPMIHGVLPSRANLSLASDPCPSGSQTSLSPRMSPMTVRSPSPLASPRSGTLPNQGGARRSLVLPTQLVPRPSSDHTALASTADKSFQLSSSVSSIQQPQPRNNSTPIALRPPPLPARRSAGSNNYQPKAEGLRSIPSRSDLRHVRKVLSMDGGGVRGLSELMILEYLMKLLARQRGFAAGQIIHPWQEFDLICGTSTGGLLAIMLGRLRMSIEECKSAYLDLSKRIFTPARNSTNAVGRAFDFLGANAKFESTPLEECIKVILADRELPENELLRDDRTDLCRVFVCAVKENSSATRIRSYETDEYDDLLEECQIWQAARATSAASTFFEPITIGRYGQKFVDGALRYNNPIALADDEARNIWPREERMIISFGTGVATPGKVTGSLAALLDTMKNIVIDTEEAYVMFFRQHQHMVEKGHLYRFNVIKGLDGVGLQEYQFVSSIADYTQEYLSNPEVMRLLKQCAGVMKDGGQRLDLVGGEDLALHVERMKLNEVFAESCSTCRRGIAYNAESFFCIPCLVHICNDCQSGHLVTHISKMLRTRQLSWQAKMPDTIPTAICTRCQMDCKARFQCLGRSGEERCDFALCCNCITDANKQVFQDHSDEKRHRMWAQIMQPGWFCLDILEPDCECERLPNVVSHCGRCLGPVKIGDTYFICRTCALEYGSRTGLCSACFAVDDPAHKGTHQYQTVHTRMENASRSRSNDLEEEIRNMFRCTRCPAILAGDAVIRHEHDKLLFVLGPHSLENISHAALRKCYQGRKGIRALPVKNPTNYACNLCMKAIAFNERHIICLCCTESFCLECYQRGLVRHRHPTKLAYCTPKNVTSPESKSKTVHCDTCQSNFLRGRYVGLHCVDCDNYDYCILCLKAMLGDEEACVPDHSRCPNAVRGHGGRNWIFFREK